MTYAIKGLPPTEFEHLWGLSDDALAQKGAKRVKVEEGSGIPDRIELRDAVAGENVILLNYLHQPADTPYRSSHAIFVIEGAQARFDAVGSIPQVMRSRTLSLRGFSSDGMMVDAEVVGGDVVEEAIERLFANAKIAYIHAHYVKYGCFSARIDRVGVTE